MRLKSVDVLRARMRKMGFTTRRLAEQAGTHHSAVDHLLAGRRVTIGDDKARRLAETLEISVYSLFEGVR